MYHVDSKTPIEVRTTENGLRLAGHAAVFYDENRSDETQYEIREGIFERIHRGAFDQSLAGGEDIVALYQHDTKQPLARTSAGTLRLRSDDRGLAFEMDLADTSRARDLAADVAAGNISGASFGFNIPEGGVRREKNVRHVCNVQLREVSMVTFPAYPGTDVYLRSADRDPVDESGYRARQRRVQLLDKEIAVE